MIDWILAGLVLSTCIGFWVLSFYQERINRVCLERVNKLQERLLELEEVTGELWDAMYDGPDEPIF